MNGHLRKLARFGVELVVERVPAMITDCNYIRELIYGVMLEKCLPWLSQNVVLKGYEIL